MQVSEKAIGYFERAALMQPDDVKWQLMIASCYRRSGNYHKALDTYKAIHRKFPENIECLKFLVKISSDMGLKDTMDYAQELKKAERAKDLRERASSSRPGSRRSSSRASNLSTDRNGSAVRNKSVYVNLHFHGPNAKFQLSHDLNSPLTGSRQASSRIGSRGSVPGSAVSAKSATLKPNFLEEEEDDFQPAKNEIDPSYSDPIGPAPERPRTSLNSRAKEQDDDFGDEDIGDDLLPE